MSATEPRANGIQRRVRSFLTCAIIGLTAGFSAVSGAGLPGEYLLSSRWRELFGVHSALTNPAFLTEENYVTLRGAYAPVLQGAFQLTEVGVTVPIGLYQSAGVTWIGEFDGDIENAGFDPITGQILLSDSASTTTSNTNSFVILSYAINPWNRLSVGANLTWAFSSNFGEPVSGIGLDLGAAYRLPRHPLLGDHLFGVSTVNLIAPSMSSGIFSFGHRGEYSRDLKLSWAGSLADRRLDLAVDYDLKDFFSAANEFSEWNAAESTWEAASNLKTLEWGLSARAGLWLLRLFSLHYAMGFGPQGVEYWGLAGGINAPSLNNGRDLSFLYQFNLKRDSSENNASAHTFYLRAEVGKHREELYARRMARIGDMSPNELYNRAMTLFSQGKYWDAFFIYSRILADFPEFFKNDWVMHYRARCEEELDMRATSAAMFESMKTAYPQSDAVPYSDLGIMRICYRNDDFMCVSNQFTTMTQVGVPDSLRYHAAYLMGEAYLKQKEYQKAIQVFILVPTNHPMYVFAQHSTAVARILAELPRDQVDLALSAVLDAHVWTPEQREVVNRSYLFFGYLFYEDAALPKAVKALRSIPETSYYYQDALLGLGWCAIKAQQWNDCVDAGRRLAALPAATLAVKLEAALIEAYGHMMTKNYQPAFTLLDNARTKLLDYVPPNDDSLAVRKTECESSRIGYDQLAQKTEIVSVKAPSTYMLQQIDSLHAQQIAHKDTIDKFLKYADEFGRAKFFSRPIDKIKEDVEYAHATVQRRVAETTGGAVKKTQQTKEEQQKVDEEIQKLKEEMKQMDQKK